MRGVVRTGNVIYSACTVGDGARLPVTAGSSHRRTILFVAELSDEHYPGRHAATRRPTARMPYRQEREQTMTASILYGRRNISYGRHG